MGMDVMLIEFNIQSKKIILTIYFDLATQTLLDNPTVLHCINLKYSFISRDSYYWQQSGITWINEIINGDDGIISFIINDNKIIILIMLVNL